MVVAPLFQVEGVLLRVVVWRVVRSAFCEGKVGRARVRGRRERGISLRFMVVSF